MQSQRQRAKSAVCDVIFHIHISIYVSSGDSSLSTKLHKKLRENCISAVNTGFRERDEERQRESSSGSGEGNRCNLIKRLSYLHRFLPLNGCKNKESKTEKEKPIQTLDCSVVSYHIAEQPCTSPLEIHVRDENSSQHTCQQGDN